MSGVAASLPSFGVGTADCGLRSSLRLPGATNTQRSQSTDSGASLENPEAMKRATHLANLERLPAFAGNASCRAKTYVWEHFGQLATGGRPRGRPKMGIQGEHEPMSSTTRARY